MRFFIIDPSLYDSGGHNMDYALQVAESVESQGWRTVILANNKSDLLSLNSSVRQFVPVHSQGLRDPERLSVRLKASILARIRHITLLAGKPWPSAPYEPLYARARTLINELLPYLATAQLQPGEKLFFPTLTWADAAVLGETLTLDPHLNSVEVNIVFRFDPPQRADQRARLKSAFAANRENIKLWADTPELAESYASFLGVDIQKIRMPFPLLRSDMEFNQNAVAFLGEGRRDKGFHLLPELVKIARSSTKFKDLEFYIQILADPNADPLVTESAKRLEASQDKGLHILRGSLSNTEYGNLISSAGAILCLHDPAKYISRSAGVITQTIRTGVPIVLRAGDSSPANMIERNHCSDLAHYCDESPESILGAIDRALTVTVRRPRYLDCTDSWGAPWLNLRDAAALTAATPTL